MPQLSYPGVYIEEVASGVRTITAVPTSIAAFVDFFREGPMNEAVQLLGLTDFQRIFGGLDDRSEASYAISQFFLNGGQECWVVRVATDNSGGGLPLATADTTIQDETVAGTVLTISAASAGDWGNHLRVDVDHDTDDPADRFNLFVRRYDDTGQSVLVEESYLSLSTDSTDDRFVETIVNDGSNLIQVQLGANLALPASTGTVGASIAAMTQATMDALGVGPRVFDVTIGGTTETATLDTWTAGTVTTLAQVRGRVEKAIRQADPLNPAFAGASVDLVNSRLIVRSGKKASTYDTAEIVSIAVNGADTAATDLGFAAGTIIENVQEYQVGDSAAAATGAWTPGTAGADGDLPSAADMIGSQAVDPPTGMFALDKVDLFNILALPRVARSDFTDTEMTAVVSNAQTYCTERRAFMIIDIPESVNTIQEMKDWMTAHDDFRDKNAATYFPRLLIPDPLKDFRLRNVPASGTVAGIYARTDAQRGVWKAPAGIEASLQGVSELAFKMTDRQNGTLNVIGINCLRVFPINGKVVWGARTLEGADALGSEWKYVPIRRLALNLEESLFRGTKWVVFEPNDEPLWANIRLNLNAFMNSLFRQGAFQGTDPKNAYFVKVDSETTTEDDRNKGIVNIEVGFAPLKPAEFVVIRIQQMRGDL